MATSPDDPRMRRRRQLLIGLAAGLALLAVGVLLAERHLKGVLVRMVQARTGREIRIEGDLRVHLLTLAPSLTAERVYIGNPPWMPPGRTAEIGQVTLLLRWRMSLPPLAIRELELRQAHLFLLRVASKRSNWTLRERDGGSGPPLMERFSMPDGRLELHDERRHLDFSGTVNAGNGGTLRAGAPVFEIAGEGRLNGRPATFLVRGEPLAQARRDHPYHFTLTEHSADDRLSAEVSLDHPFDFHVLEGSFEASGPDLKHIYYLVGLRLIDTGAYRVSGKLLRDHERFEYRELAARSGSSDVGGTLVVDSAQQQPQISGTLTSSRLRLADLGPHAADESAAAGQTSGSSPLSATAVHWRVLQRANWSVRLSVADLELGRWTLHDVAARLRIDHGVLTLEKLGGAFADGKLSGELHIDATQAVTAEQVRLDLSALQLADLAGAHRDGPPLSGALNARLQLSGAGESLKDMLASAEGNISAVIPQGTVRASLAESASLDLAGALRALVHSDKETGIRCAVADFAAHNGVLTARTLLADTDPALITGSGQVHLDPATLDLTLRGRPKHPRLVLHSEIRVQGSLTHPDIRPNTPAVLAQSAAAVALGTVLSPVAAVLAFVNPGLAHDADCAALIAQAHTPASPAP
jgi:AsmA family protein